MAQGKHENKTGQANSDAAHSCTCTFLYLKSYQTPIFNQEQPLSAPPAAPPQHQHQHHGRPHSHHDPQPLLLPLVLLSVLLPVFELSTDCFAVVLLPKQGEQRGRACWQHRVPIIGLPNSENPAKAGSSWRCAPDP